MPVFATEPWRFQRWLARGIGALTLEAAYLPEATRPILPCPGFHCYQQVTVLAVLPRQGQPLPDQELIYTGSILSVDVVQ
jgi:hypothetical protein